MSFQDRTQHQISQIDKEVSLPELPSLVMSILYLQLLNELL